MLGVEVAPCFEIRMVVQDVFTVSVLYAKEALSCRNIRQSNMKSGTVCGILKK